jgi:hypothetical protein
MKRDEEGGELRECTFAPKTGRGPTSGPKATVAGLPAALRLYAQHGSKYAQVSRFLVCQRSTDVLHGTITRLPHHHKSSLEI